ncbi:C-type lectin domain-containing protein [Methylocucumis oryzae]|uniref:C-type lectin domain-containing protein n=1 Tax=Methylocucumis oryzae TaxID=1632867 RepID=UPI0006980759|nr:C-type lectin domain-containing protein [Methylocucumis oryzae]
MQLQQNKLGNALRKLFSPSCLTTSLIGSLVLITSTGAYADSNKIKWDSNGHFYQRFDRNFTWNESKAYCESLSAHLATITSDEENTFITSKVLPGGSYADYYYIGATDETTEGVWKWITGEPFAYNHWQPGQPNCRNGENYLLIYYTDSFWIDGFDDNGASNEGLICEWSYNTFIGSTAIGSTAVPDINGNGYDEIAALYVDYQTSQHNVVIKDSKTGKLLSKLSFATDDHPPLGVVSVADLNDNGLPEIAVLYTDPSTGVPKVTIKDVKNNKQTLKSFNVLGLGYTAKDITAIADLNGNGTDELTVIGVNGATGKAKSETRDSLGKILGKAEF